ncbi:MAG: cache domain-containing protein [Desulfovibrio sp.]|nr:cache domain-containing protein [Desulfovibrio sp.]
MSIGNKLMLLLGMCLILICLALQGVAGWVLGDLGEGAAMVTLDSVKQATEREVADIMYSLDRLGALIEKDDRFIAAVAARDIAKIMKFATEYMNGLFVDMVTVMDKDAVVLFRVHNPGQSGDVRHSANVDAAIKKGRRVVGFESGKLIRLNLSVAIPLFNREGELVGSVAAGRDLSTKGDFVAETKRIFDVESTIFLKDERVTTTLTDERGKSAVGTKLGNLAIRDAVLLRGETVFADSPILGVPYKTVYWPWRNSEGEVGGIFFAGKSKASLEAARLENIKLVVIVGFACCFLLSFPATLIIRGIVDPMKELEHGVGAVMLGDYSRRVATEAKDEIGHLSRTFQSMIEQTKARLGFAQSLQNSITIPFVMVNSNGAVIDVNRQFLDLWGLTGTSENHLGKTSGTLLYGKAMGRTMLDNVIASGEPVHDVSVTRTNAKGAVLSLRISVSPLLDLDGKCIGACMFLVDETAAHAELARVIALNGRITESGAPVNETAPRHESAFFSLVEQFRMTGENLDTIVQTIEETVNAVRDISMDTARQAKVGAELAKKMGEMLEMAGRAMADTNGTEKAVAGLVELSRDLKRTIDGLVAETGEKRPKSESRHLPPKGQEAGTPSGRREPGMSG